MKNRLIAFGLGCMAALSLHAIPAQKGIWRTLTLQNGTEIKVELCGDEFLSYWQDADGNRYTQTNLGLVPANMQTLSQNAQQMRALAYADKAGLTTTASGRRPLKKAASYKGEKHCLIILVEFADMPFSMSDPNAFYNRVANEEGFNEGDFKGSLTDYFHDQSNGQFKLTFDIAGPYRLSNYADYGKDYDNGGHDRNVQAMISAACSRAYSAGYDFSQYDWDGDGEVDLVYVLYAGQGQATGGDDDTIWPHKSVLTTPFNAGSKVVRTYACSNEIGSTKGKVAGIGTICHEFSHCLGYPDLYDVNYGGLYGMGTWDLMCSGNYNGGGFIPAGYTAYEKMVAGWIDPIVLDDNTSVTGMKPLADGGDAYIFRNPGEENEYYLIENRQKTGWDAGLAASGILINHIDYDSYVWARNYPNTNVSGVNDHERVTIVSADNNRSSSTEAGDPWPYGNKNSLSNTSSPACVTYNNNTTGVKRMNIALTNMAVASDGTASFNFSNFNKGGSQDGFILHETFDKCQGTGGNDDQGFTPPKVALNFAQGEFAPDCQGWEGSYMRGASMCARVGVTSVDQATIVSPEFPVDGTATLKFKAAPYGTDGTNLKLSVSDGATISQTDFTMTKDQWTDFSATINANGKVRITFVGERRYFLDEIEITAAQTAIGGVVNDVNVKTDGRIYTIGGVYVGTDFESLPKGVYIVGGKKVVK